MPGKIPEISREKQKLLYRIKRLRGQFAAVERSLTAGDECADILMLLAAIRGGVNSLMAEILEGHIKSHVLKGRQKPSSEQVAAADEVIDMVKSYLK